MLAYGWLPAWAGNWWEKPDTLDRGGITI